MDSAVSLRLAVQASIRAGSSQSVDFIGATFVFSVTFRDRVRDEVLRLAASDSRVVAGAVIGSLAHGRGDRWSDLDLTFAVADEASLTEVLEHWTRHIADKLEASHLFDVSSGARTYRVFLLPDCLQLDLSFAPASEFTIFGPHFELLFGSAVNKPSRPPPLQVDLFGNAVHHALRARISIERGRYWHAEYWISSTRDCALALACCRRDLQTHSGRGFDDLPPAVQDRFLSTLVGSLDRDELLRALGCVIDGLVQEMDNIPRHAKNVESELRKLIVPWRLV